MISFKLLGFKTLPAVPAVYPFSKWIVSANSDEMYNQQKH